MREPPSRRRILLAGLAALGGLGVWRVWQGTADGGDDLKVLEPVDTPSPTRPATAVPKATGWPVIRPEGSTVPLHHSILLYCMDRDGILRAIDDRTGAERWRRVVRAPGAPTLPPEEQKPIGDEEEPVLALDRIVVRSGEAVGVDTATGKEEWRRTYPPGRFYSDGRRVVFLEAFEDSEDLSDLHGVDPDTGEPTWRVGGRDFREVLVHRGTVITAEKGWKEVAGIDALTGKERWRHDVVSGEVHGKPVMALEDSVIIFDWRLEDDVEPGDGFTVAVFRIRADTGEKVWGRTFPLAAQGAPVLSGSSLHLVSENQLVTIDTADGRTLWTRPHRLDTKVLDLGASRETLLLRLSVMDPPGVNSTTSPDAAPRSGFLAVDARTGKREVTFEVPAYQPVLLTVDGESAAFADHTDPARSMLYVVDIRRGTFLWSRELDGKGYGLRAQALQEVVFDGAVLRRHGSDRLDVFDRRTGEPLRGRPVP
ncbi:PQQ-binding-like beta-propeller repeat protein [Streptomyces sp. NPDC002054]|uniref:outer membrane protein assembly factor BamB family protein n=1 Tax=Streptomyces sp. NPDC002054 TaxID=3154663 RepID=UPI00331A1105